MGIWIPSAFSLGPDTVIEEPASVVTATLPVPSVKASMPQPAAALIVASLVTLTLPATAASELGLLFEKYPAVIPPGGYPLTSGWVPELMVPSTVTVILAEDAIADARLAATIPSLAELMTSPAAIDTVMLPLPQPVAPMP